MVGSADGPEELTVGLADDVEELVVGSADDVEELTAGSADVAVLTAEPADDSETVRKIGSTVDDLDDSSNMDDPDVASVEEAEPVTTVWFIG